jgi:hypothetical protein
MSLDSRSGKSFEGSRNLSQPKDTSHRLLQPLTLRPLIDKTNRGEPCDLRGKEWSRMLETGERESDSERQAAPFYLYVVFPSAE